MGEPFEVLGVSAAASLVDARKAFKKLAQIYHPDRYTNAAGPVRAAAEEHMRDLNAAFAEFVSRRRGGPDPAELLASEKWLADWWEAKERLRREDDVRRIRFNRWDEIEQARIRREEAESRSIASVMRAAYGGEDEDSEPKQALPSPALPPAKPSKLAERLREAKKAEARKIDLATAAAAPAAAAPAAAGRNARPRSRTPKRS